MPIRYIAHPHIRSEQFDKESHRKFIAFEGLWADVFFPLFIKCLFTEFFESQVVYFLLAIAEDLKASFMRLNFIFYFKQFGFYYFIWCPRWGIAVLVLTLERIAVDYLNGAVGFGSYMGHDSLQR